MNARTAAVLSLCTCVLSSACGPELDPLTLEPQRAFLAVSLDTAPGAGQVTELPAKTFEFALSSTFDFDHLCRTDGPLRLDARADAAPGLQLGVASWAARGPNRWGVDCADAQEPCDRAKFVVRWDTPEGRWDATLSAVGNGLAAASACTAQVSADALASEQVVIEATCTNLLTTLTPAGSTDAQFGPSVLQWRALCPRPE